MHVVSSGLSSGHSPVCMEATEALCSACKTRAMHPNATCTSMHPPVRLHLRLLPHCVPLPHCVHIPHCFLLLHRFLLPYCVPLHHPPLSAWQVAYLHGARAQPVGGGEVIAAGTAWVCPQVSPQVPSGELAHRKLREETVCVLISLGINLSFMQPLAARVQLAEHVCQLTVRKHNELLLDRTCH